MTLVVDASVMAEALAKLTEHHAWAVEVVCDGGLAAPNLMPFETANVLRRSAAAGILDHDTASDAHEDLLGVRVRYFGYDLLARRVWDLRQNLTAYDACYVALAELLGAPLATLDFGLARATEPRCEFLTPPQALRSG